MRELFLLLILFAIFMAGIFGLLRLKSSYEEAYCLEADGKPLYSWTGIYKQCLPQTK